MNHSNNLTVNISVSQTRKAGVGIVSCPFMNQSEVIKGPGSWGPTTAGAGEKEVILAMINLVINN